MPRPGTSGGGHRSSGGHSSSRVGGGHHVGRSSRPTGSSSFNRGPSMHHYHHTPPPPRRGYYGYRRNVYTSSSSGLGTLIACLIVFAVVIFSFFMIASDDSDVTSTINREKIENPIPYDNNCIKDELGYVENTSKLSKNLKNFYNKTGIQPYIYLKSYDETLTSDSQKDNYAQNWYEQNIDNEDTFLFVYYEDQNPNEIGYMAYVNGKQVTSVMDSEAVNIFWNYIDRYWTDDSLSTVEVFTKTFNSTANTIMEKSTTSNDIIKIICIIVGIVIVIGGIIYILRMKFKRDKEKAKETVEILKTPLDKSDELRDKYLNEEGKE
jgi:ABC-type antimicrobial peptide transport system permease subunit